ncbi:MAG: class I SAM-dependent methyltransferase [Dehalococcoidia bacterium]|nr:class I SAM-dependent methyltransferase [Dehalococcoidia bacterium]
MRVNALHLATRGHEVWGIDGTPTDLRMARAKAMKRGLKATFRLADALNLGRLGKIFDTVIDSGLFHTFSDKERVRFARSLATIIGPGGDYFSLVFSEYQTGFFGPRRVTQAEIRSTFSDGWRVNYIREARIEANDEPAGVRAWLSSIARL